MRLLVGVLICLRDILFGQEVLGDVKNRKLIFNCYTLNAPKKHHIVDISLNYVNFLLKQPLLHEIHDLLAFHYLKELIFQETTISANFHTLCQGSALFSTIFKQIQYVINSFNHTEILCHKFSVVNRIFTRHSSTICFVYVFWIDFYERLLYDHGWWMNV